MVFSHLESIAFKTTLPLLDDRYKVNVGDEVQVNILEDGAVPHRTKKGIFFGTIGEGISKSIRLSLMMSRPAESKNLICVQTLKPNKRNLQGMNDLDAAEPGLPESIVDTAREGRGAAYMQSAQRHIANIVISLSMWHDEFEILRFSLRNIDNDQDLVCPRFAYLLNALRQNFAQAERVASLLSPRLGP